MNRLVVVSNRVPVPSGGKQAGGLAVALEGVMDQSGGVWFGWSGDIADDADCAAPKVVEAGGVEFATVDLTRDEHDRYYNNFSNGVLWPLLHTLPELVKFERADAAAYRAVNVRLAQALKPLLKPSDMVWVHDYHMLPMPAALREAGVRNPIGFFLHIPFASPDVLATVPDMPGFVRDLLGADLIGFQTDNDLANFAQAAEALTGASRVHGTTLHLPGPNGGRRVRLGVFPVEIDAKSVAAMARDAQGSEGVAEFKHSLGEQKLLIGAERLDPTKGLLQRVAGLRTFFAEHPDWQGHATMVQIAASSRKDVTSYQNLRTALDREAGALNADIGTPAWQPLRVVSRAVDRELVAGYLRIARVGLVTPVRDGMNLVAKEFVAAQNPDDPGVLVLSRFAGAAQQLEAAVLVNPHDSCAVADAIHTGLQMPIIERRERWQSMWTTLEDRTPAVWGRSFITALLRAAAAPASIELRVRQLGAEPPKLPGSRATSADRIRTSPLTVRERAETDGRTIN